MSEGSVMVTFKIMPESVETDMEALQERVKDETNPSKMKIVPIAFGLKSLVIVKVIAEKDGLLEETEKKLRDIEGVKEVEVTNVARSW